jgi:hypothetical protein
MRKTSSRIVKIVLGSVFVALLTSAAPALADETVYSCGLTNAGAQNKILRYVSVYGINPSSDCGVTGMGVTTTAANVVPQGRAGGWVTTTPTGLAISGVIVPPGALDVQGAVGTGYVTEFYWNGGSGRVSNVINGQFGWGGLSSSNLGFQIRCAATTCRANSDMQVNDIALQVHETQGPWLSAPDGLWQASGWVRQDWTLRFYGDSPSGLCSLSASIDGQPVPAPSGAGVGADQTWWHECAGASFSQTVHTWDFGQGAVRLTIRGTDAAAVATPDPGYTKTVYIDNSQPTVSLSGPADAPSTAGTQYVSATAGGSPSGIYGLECAVDGAPAHWYPGANAQVPVGGFGQHSVKCSAANNAIDPAGNHGWSTWTGWAISIREPTVAGISFGTHLLDALRCRRVRERVKVPARWVTVRRHGKLVTVKRRSHTKVVKVMRCHPRVVRVRVRVRIHGRWHWRWDRQVRLPHTVQRSTWRARFGAPTTVVGWLGTSNGNALGGQAVRVLIAPDNGSNTFTQAAVANTSADGSWTAKLPAGPSRLVEAVYGGASTLEPSVSGQVHVSVPAKVRLISISPQRVAWGGTVRIVGQLEGGYLPPGGALVRLRIGLGSSYTTYGVQEHVTGNGRFSTAYTFGVGDPSVYRSLWFQLASLPMGNYPFSPANSGRRTVVVGGHPSIPPTRHRHGGRKHKRRR